MALTNQLGQQENATTPIVAETISQVKPHIQKCRARLFEGKRLLAESAAIIKELNDKPFKKETAQLQKTNPNDIQLQLRPL